MAESEKTYSVEKQIEALNQQYEALLERGAEFRVLRDIKDRLKELKRQLNGDGKSNHTPGHDGKGNHNPGHDGKTNHNPRHDGETNQNPGHDGKSYHNSGQDGSHMDGTG
jgi:hypothetical protein